MQPESPAPVPAPPFFIVGCGRSGTTLLRTMLNHHPLLGIPVESLFIADYLRGGEQGAPLPRLIRLLVNDYEFAEWRMPVTAADFEGCTDAPALIERIHARYLAQAGKHIWGQKTPRFIRHGALLKRHFPGARFIHILRDPRAVVNSLMTSTLHRSNALYAARRWVRDVEAGLALRAAWPADVLEVRYEALVSSPEAELRRVCDFLGVDFTPAMLDYHEKGKAEYSSFFDQAHARLNEPPRAERAEAWRTSLTPQQIALTEWLCAETMHKVGYPLTHPNPAPPRPGLVRWLHIERYWGLLVQIVERVIKRPRELWTFFWRKWRLGLFWRDLSEVNY